MISKLLKKDKKGFTLMEMLIVVAIIAILVAIMIPTMTNQLEKARQAADLANVRAAYAEAMVDSLTNDDGNGTSNSFTMTKTAASFNKITDLPTYLTSANGWSDVAGATKGDTVTATVDADGVVTFTVG